MEGMGIVRRHSAQMAHEKACEAYARPQWLTHVQMPTVRVGLPGLGSATVARRLRRSKPALAKLFLAMPFVA